MNYLGRFLDSMRNTVRSIMTSIANILNTLSGGRLSPNTITLTGLLAHIPIAWLIATQHNLKAAALLAFFGLFDALDGALARLQKKAGSSGMLLDASTDRMKEVLLYSGSAYALIASGYQYWAVWAVVACGASLLVSYVKAKGETAVAGGSLTPNEVNRLFQDGLMRFEIRMFFLVIGLLTNNLRYVVATIAILSLLTAIGRLQSIMKRL